MKNFNIKIFAIQLVASVLLFLGIQQFYVLAELDLIELVHSMGKENFAFLVRKSDEFGISEKLKHLATMKTILSFVGIVLAYVLCSVINHKRNYDWKIAVTIVILCFLVFQFRLINLPINFIATKNLALAYFVPAIFSILISFVLFFFSYKIKVKN
ncbi:hypothetical protein [Empedobacter sp. UBA7248]|uniref:hypothetical protein n=1 Tax=Empedobacter sp. UBA7248 TaxID=1946448 RepID=UPI0025C170D2|nr:hypothetical protein [Empedobacter sp. UBA7248]